MKIEDKQLLLQDLCARLPYGVKISVDNNVESLQGINILDNVAGYGTFLSSDIEEVKPYLFPLSSMTEEQKNDLTKNLHSNVFVKDEISFWCLFTANMMGEWKKVFEWCVKNHFDICGLIPMGLAIDATNKNIY